MSNETPKTNKEKILQAASELLLEKGLAGLSVRAIAQRAQLSTIAIYSHFQGKQGVLDALYVEGFERVYAGMRQAQRIDDPVEAATRACETYLQIAHENEARYRLIFGENGLAYTPSKEAEDASRRAFGALVVLTARLLPDGASVEHQQRDALRLWASLHGYVSLRHHVIGELLAYEEWQPLVMRSITDDINRLHAGSARAPS